MRKFGNKLLSLGLALGLGLGFTVASVDSAKAWEPKKPVEFVIMAGKGGGADKAVRFIQSIIAKNKLSAKPFTPINKPGGSGAEALVHVKDVSDPDHTLDRKSTRRNSSHKPISYAVFRLKKKTQLLYQSVN